MARLASVAKGGFYPIPPTMTDLIIAHLRAPAGGRVLDPCAGEGVALATIATALGLEAYGIELHQARAEAAQERLAPLAERPARVLNDHHRRRVLQGDYRTLHTTRGGFNCLYLNPPYHEDADAIRLEYQWLRDTREWLQPDGILVYVIPQAVLGLRQIARSLASWYTQLQVSRFPDPEYQAFHQVVVFGVRRPQVVAPDNELVQRLVDQAGGIEDLPWLTCLEQVSYMLPTPMVPSNRFYFYGSFIEPEDAAAEATCLGVRTLAAWSDHLAPVGALALPVTPLMPLKVGHLAGLMAAGFLDNQHLVDGEEHMLIKGRAYKRLVYAQEVETRPDGSEQQVNTATEQVVTDVTTLSPTGEVRSLAGADLEAFLTRWLGPLTARVAATYPPTYAFDDQGSGFAPILDRLSLTRQIPGLDYGGLLPAQKHVAAALATRLVTQRDAILVGEMGTGKTTVGIAVAAALGARRTLILCPPHLVHKWKREAEVVWEACEVTILTTISEVDRWFALDESRPRVAVLSHSKAKLASGWHHSYDWWQPSDTSRQAYAARVQARHGGDWEARLAAALLKYSDWRGVRCPDCGASQRDAEGLPLRPADIEQRRVKRSCFACRAPLYQFDRQRTKHQAPGSFRASLEREVLVHSPTADEGIQQALLGLTRAPGPKPAGLARWPLGRYLRQHYGGRLELLIADEAHHFKAGDSDQAYAFQDLIQASRKVLAMTGTIFGGKASSLFYLLYRLSPEVRLAFTNSDQTGIRRLGWRQWGALYGVQQEIETTKLDPESSKLTAKSRSTVRVKELPGASPAMLPWLLNRTAFLSLADLGFALPSYEEIPVMVEMTPEQATSYTSLYKQLQTELKHRLVRREKSLLGAYLQALLCWVDAPWRAEVVLDPRTRDREAEGIRPVVVARVNGLPAEVVYPKEQAILDLILAEKAAGRRSLLFCQQTGTRDITPRWVKLLTGAGLKVAVLKVEPDQREAWVEQQLAAGVEVLITHPRRVETGLDMVAFPTLIWSGIEYSVYTVLQASRRSWRLGQTQPVKVYHVNYAETLQHEALYLIAAKVAAAVRVNGDVVGDDSLAELDALTATDLVTALARIVTEQGASETRSLREAFAHANAEMHAAQGWIGAEPLAPEGNAAWTMAASSCPHAPVEHSCSKSECAVIELVALPLEGSPLHTTPEEPGTRSELLAVAASSRIQPSFPLKRPGATASGPEGSSHRPSSPRSLPPAPVPKPQLLPLVEREVAVSQRRRRPQPPLGPSLFEYLHSAQDKMNR
jgi:16S rRNA G966 N2-methylase RsmD